MHTRINHVLLVSTLILSACASERGPSNAERTDGVAPAAKVATFVAAVDGGLAVLDAGDGHVVARADLEAPATQVDDLVVDVTRGRVITFEIDPEEEGGALFARQLDSLSRATALGGSAGVVRFDVLGAQVLVFEDAHGPRWRTLDARRSTSAPTPRSTFTLGDRFGALTLEDGGAWAVRTVGVADGELVDMRLGAAPTLSSASARAVWSGGRFVGLDIAKGTLAIDGVDTHLPATAVVDACVLSGTSFAVLTAGPTRLVVQASDGVRSTVLPGEPRFDARTLSHAIVAVSASRVLVGTTQRVLALDAAKGGWTVDPTFVDHGAHAPLAPLWAGPGARLG